MWWWGSGLGEGVRDHCGLSCVWLASSNEVPITKVITCLYTDRRRELTPLPGTPTNSFVVFYGRSDVVCVKLIAPLCVLRNILRVDETCFSVPKHGLRWLMAFGAGESSSSSVKTTPLMTKHVNRQQDILCIDKNVFLNGNTSSLLIMFRSDRTSSLLIKHFPRWHTFGGATKSAMHFQNMVLRSCWPNVFSSNRTFRLNKTPFAAQPHYALEIHALHSQNMLCFEECPFRSLSMGPWKTCSSTAKHPLFFFNHVPLRRNILSADKTLSSLAYIPLGMGSSDETSSVFSEYILTRNGI